MSIYFDNSATTKIRREALDKYIEISEGVFGNPSSLHAEGFLAEKELRQAKDAIRATLGDKCSEVIFTASGSEANNLAILGRAYSKERYLKGAKIITTEGEHASVNSPLERLESCGFKVARIPTAEGAVDMEALSRELTADTILVSVMMVNNETGAYYDVPAIARLIKAKCPNCALHVDATQSYLKLPFTKSAIGADMITVSSHKIEGPKGVGALVVDKSIIKERGISPIIFGGGQEGGLRSGTENVPAIAAFATAARLGYSELVKSYEATTALRERLIEGLTSRGELSEVSLTLPERHAPHILNITLPNIKSETMLHYLSSQGIFVSSGSACSSNSAHISSALIAYGRSEKEADCSIRISLSKRNTAEEVDAFLDALATGVAKLSRMK